MIADRRARRPRPLWTCPKCEARFIVRNQWHSCGQATLASWRARMGPKARRLYRRLEEAVAACGDYRVAPAKTRLAFQARVRFAAITSLSERGMTFGFSLPYALASPRFVKVDEVVRGWWEHRLRITEPRQIDQEVRRWVRRSYRLMGMRERLTGRTRPRRER